MDGFRLDHTRSRFGTTRPCFRPGCRIWHGNRRVAANPRDTDRGKIPNGKRIKPLCSWLADARDTRDRDAPRHAPQGYTRLSASWVAPHSNLQVGSSFERSGVQVAATPQRACLVNPLIMNTRSVPREIDNNPAWASPAMLQDNNNLMPGPGITEVRVVDLQGRPWSGVRREPAHEAIVTQSCPGC